MNCWSAKLPFFFAKHKQEEDSNPQRQFPVSYPPAATIPRTAMADGDFFKDYPPVAADGPESSGAAINLGAPPAAAAAADTNPFDAADDDGYDASPAPASPASGGGSTAASLSDAASEPEEEADPGPTDCAAVAAWRADFARGLEEKARAEREGKAERAQAAREALEKMHAGWERRCAGAREENAGREKEMIRERDGVLARMSKAGEKPNWSVVPELVDVSGKFKEGQRDTSRMRQVLMRLKTT